MVKERTMPKDPGPDASPEWPLAIDGPSEGEGQAGHGPMGVEVMAPELAGPGATGLKLDSSFAVQLNLVTQCINIVSINNEHLPLRGGRRWWVAWVGLGG